MFETQVKLIAYESYRSPKTGAVYNKATVRFGGLLVKIPLESSVPMDEGLIDKDVAVTFEPSADFKGNLLFTAVKLTSHGKTNSQGA